MQFVGRIRTKQQYSRLIRAVEGILRWSKGRESWPPTRPEARFAVFGVEPSVGTAPALVRQVPQELDRRQRLLGIHADQARTRGQIPVVAIGKKGNRNEEEDEQEHSWLFRVAQRFRAGIEETRLQ